MENYVVWPDFWLNVALLAACLILVMMLIFRNKSQKSSGKGSLVFESFGDFFLGIITNKVALAVVCVLSLLAGFVGTLCLLHFAESDGFVFCMYILLGVLLPLVPVACCAEECSAVYCSSTLLGFVHAAGNSLMGLIFLICNHFPYMWYALAFLILNFIGIVLESYRLRRC